ncbi:hypothetical protein HG531_009134 [Fusarium graminearum]|nr:hypothetical protein HG531_009134 [Fusarium graminearum]
MRLLALLVNLNNGLGVKINSICDTGKVVDNDREGRLGRNLCEEALHDTHCSRFAKLESLLGGMSTDTGHEGEVRADGLAREGNEFVTLLAGEEECLCIGAHDDEAIQA